MSAECGANIVERDGAVTRPSAGRSLDPEEANAVMRAAGMEPLVPYPGSAKPWPCIHIQCGKEVTPLYSSIQRGRRGCRFCGGGAVDHKEAEAVMRAAGMEPLTPYPGSSKPWPCIHLKCGRKVRPHYYDVKKGGSGCRFCFHQGRFIDPEAANAVMRAAGLEPLVPYPGSNKSWRCRCLTCGKEVMPLYTSVQQGHRGCRFCARRLDDEEAKAVMLAAGLEPLVPYPGTLSPWLCRCLTCGKEVDPRRADIKGGGGCRFCAPCGYNPGEPGHIYLIQLPTHPGFSDGVIKVGIAGVRSIRLDRFQKLGWYRIESLQFEDGAIPAAIERAVLNWLRGDLDQTWCLNPSEMNGMGGNTETFSIGDLLDAGVTVGDVANRIYQEAAKHS
jgi:recombinational DNA repair protein (RecF pathway)